MSQPHLRQPVCHISHPALSPTCRPSCINSPSKRTLYRCQLSDFAVIVLQLCYCSLLSRRHPGNNQDMLRCHLLFMLLPLALNSLVTARPHHSLVPEDPYAFPKYRVTFLNGLPILNETAQRWLHNGLRGGELEFLDQPWEGESWRTPPVKSIEGGLNQDVAWSTQVRTMY